MFIGKEDDYHSLHGSIGMRNDASELMTLNYIRSDLIYIMILCCLFTLQVQKKTYNVHKKYKKKKLIGSKKIRVVKRSGNLTFKSQDLIHVCIIQNC